MATTVKTSEISNKATETHIVHTESGDVHITHPAGSAHLPKITVLLGSDDVVRSQARGLLNFLRDYAIVGVAVGFIVGQQAQGLIKQLIESFLTPFITLIVGQDLVNKKFSLLGSRSPIDFTWGKLIYAFINFVFVILFVYIIIKVLKLDKLSKSKKK